MPRMISSSVWRKGTVLFAAVAGFVLLYETPIFDSTFPRWQAMIRESEPPSAGSRLQFTATAYCKGTTTASGVVVRTGIAAADPQILPVGSVINIATGDKKYNGVYTVMDTGPKVQGRLLDLYMWSCHEALRFGHKGVDVTVLRLGWNPQQSSPTLIDRLFRRREVARRLPDPEPPPSSGVPPSGATSSDKEAAAAGDSERPAPPSEPAGGEGAVSPVKTGSEGPVLR